MKSCKSCHIFLVDWLGQQGIKEGHDIASRLLRILDIPKETHRMISAIVDKEVTEIELLLLFQDSQEIQVLIATLEDSIMPQVAERWLTKCIRHLWTILVDLHEDHLNPDTKLPSHLGHGSLPNPS